MLRSLLLAHGARRSGLRFLSSALPPHTVMTMPSLSPTMEQGALSQWMKKVGDAIAPGETIAVIQTDKAAIDLQATDDAFLAKTFVVDGAEGIAVGQPIGITVEDAKDVAAFANYSPPAAAAAAAPAALAAAPAPVAAAPAPAAPVAPRPAAVAAPVAAPAPAAAAPAPKPVAAAAAASASDSYTPLAFEAWGASLARAPMGQAIAKQQAAYVAAFGWGGYDAMPVAEEKRKGK